MVLALVLCVKVLVPAGHMPVASSLSLTIQVCADALGASVTREISVPLADGSQDAGGEHRDNGQPCAFSALSMASLAGADAPLLALALAFILLMGIAPASQVPPARTLRFRPPLRGPPAFG